MAEGETLNKHYSLKNISEMSAPEDQALESVDKSLAPQFTMSTKTTKAAVESTEEYPNSGKFYSYHFYHFWSWFVSDSITDPFSTSLPLYGPVTADTSITVTPMSPSVSLFFLSLLFAKLSPIFLRLPWTSPPGVARPTRTQSGASPWSYGRFRILSAGISIGSVSWLWSWLKVGLSIFLMFLFIHYILLQVVQKHLVSALESIFSSSYSWCPGLWNYPMTSSSGMFVLSVSFMKLVLNHNTNVLNVSDL